MAATTPAMADAARFVAAAGGDMAPAPLPTCSSGAPPASDAPAALTGSSGKKATGKGNIRVGRMFPSARRKMMRRFAREEEEQRQRELQEQQQQQQTEVQEGHQHTEILQQNSKEGQSPLHKNRSSEHPRSSKGKQPEQTDNDKSKDNHRNTYSISSSNKNKNTANNSSSCAAQGDKKEGKKQTPSMWLAQMDPPKGARQDKRSLSSGTDEPEDNDVLSSSETTRSARSIHSFHSVVSGTSPKAMTAAASWLSQPVLSTSPHGETSPTNQGQRQLPAWLEKKGNTNGSSSSSNCGNNVASSNNNNNNNTNRKMSSSNNSNGSSSSSSAKCSSVIAAPGLPASPNDDVYSQLGSTYLSLPPGLEPPTANEVSHLPSFAWRPFGGYAEKVSVDYSIRF